MPNQRQFHCKSHPDEREFDFPNGGTCIPTKRDGKLICKEVEEVFNIPKNKDCIPIHKDGKWNCKKEDVKPEPESGIRRLVRLLLLVAGDRG